jgi:hypothetical protein
LPSREKPSAVRGAAGTLLPWLAFCATPSTTSSCRPLMAAWIFWSAEVRAR